MNHLTLIICGDIGEDQREIELEPLTVPVPEHAPVQVPDREAVPA
ncbi:hypothetical protein [Luteipulveratus mongoliensis]|nr:hypothetical protein [Luteipulveratus mongoliensis]